MSNFVKPFRVGDEVKIKGRKGSRIIAEAVINNSGNMRYATADEAWFCQADLTLVKECSKKSMDRLIEIIIEE